MKTEIEENLKRVKEGKPLTIPLAVLNGEFKRRYFVCLNCGAPISDGNLSGYCTKCRIEYNNRKYRQNPEVKKRLREYMKKYRQKPEVKKKMREYWREYYQKPEVKKKMREYMREYYRKKNKIPKSKWRIKDENLRK